MEKNDKKNFWDEEYTRIRFIKGDYKSLYWHEIFDRICALENTEDKIDAMRNNATTGMLQYLFYVYDTEQIQFDITPGEVKGIDYRKPSHTEDSMAEITLKSEWRNFSTIVGTQPKDKRIRFLQKWFETLCEGETELVKLMFNRDLTNRYPCLSEKFIRKCFSNLLTPKKKVK